MRYLAVLILLFAAADWKEMLPAEDKVPGFLQDISCTIRAGSSEGSGVMIVRDIKGEPNNFVWTAGHVVDGIRSTVTVVDPKSGTDRRLIRFKDVQIVKELVEAGRRVGELRMDAEVIRYSEAEDLALLRVRKKGFVTASAVFYGDDAIPQLGTRLLHVGSLLGQTGANSMTDGIVAQHGRVLDKSEYDQTTVTAFPGSSGGGVYLTNGAYVGMVVRGAGEGFNLIIPIRRMKRWAKDANIEWALDPSADLPDNLDSMPVEHIEATFSRDDRNQFQTLIRNLQPSDATHVLIHD